MPAKRFTQSEQFVLTHWADATELEASIESVREKYAALCDRTLSDFCDAHPQFDSSEVKVSQFAAAAKGHILVSKASWPTSGKWVSGFWIEYLRLDPPVGDEATPPTSSVYVAPFHGDLLAAKRTIRAEAAKLLPPERWAAEDRDYSEGDNEVPFGLPFCGRNELFTLLADDAGDRFRLRLKRELEMLALLEPILDRVFSTPVK